MNCVQGDLMTKKIWISLGALVIAALGALTASAAYSVSPRIGNSAGGFSYTDWGTWADGVSATPVGYLYGLENSALVWYGFTGQGTGFGYSSQSHGPQSNTTGANETLRCSDGYLVDGLRGYYRNRPDGSTKLVGLGIWCINPATWATASSVNFIGVSTGNDPYRSVRCHNNDVGWGITGTQDSSSLLSVVRSINLLCDAPP
jgi:hypothetical protein